MLNFSAGFLTLVVIGFSSCIDEPVENRLHHELLHIRGYSKLIRPTSNNSVQLTVKMGLRLSQLLDMDEKNQIMTTSVWLRQEWTDLRLKWDPKEYGGIKMTHIPSDDLWRPDILLYNNYDIRIPDQGLSEWLLLSTNSAIFSAISWREQIGDPIFPSFLFVIPKITRGVWLSKLRMTEADIARVLHNVELVDLLLDEEKRTRFKLLRTFHQLNNVYLASYMVDLKHCSGADGDFVVTLLTKATVQYDGKIIWEPPVIYKSYCPIDVEYFPFDMQECFMKFGSWTYDGHEVDLQHICDAQAVYLDATKEKVINRGIDIKDFYPNVEWDIINVTARRKEKFYPCCPEPYPDIMFNVTLRRRTLFYSLNLIMPCVSISCLTVLVFYLPSDSGEKITLSISILLALTVFFLLLSDINPPTSFVIPLIGKYLLFTMIVVTMSIFLAVYTLGINFRRPATHRMSPWVRRVFTEILPRILLMRRPDMERKPHRVPFRTCNGIEMRDVRDIYSSSQTSSQFKEWTTENENLHKRRGTTGLQKYPREIKEAFEGVISIADHLKNEDDDNSEARDWKYIAMVMDRLFLYIFTTACACGTLSIFLYAPSLYDSRPPLSTNLHEDGNCTY